MRKKRVPKGSDEEKGQRKLADGRNEGDACGFNVGCRVTNEILVPLCLQYCPRCGVASMFTHNPSRVHIALQNTHVCVNPQSTLSKESCVHGSVVDKSYLRLEWPNQGTPWKPAWRVQCACFRRPHMNTYIIKGQCSDFSGRFIKKVSVCFSNLITKIGIEQQLGVP